MINVVIDTETTGLTKGVHEIIELAVVKLDNDFNPTPIKFVSLIRPTRWEIINKEALKTNKITLEELEVAPTPQQVRNLFITWKEEFFGLDELLLPLGHNYASFDKGFLELFFKDWYPKLFDYHCRDSSISGFFMRDCEKYDSWTGLKAQCDYFGIDCSGHHRAYNDCLLTAEVYRNLIKLNKEK